VIDVRRRLAGAALALAALAPAALAGATVPSAAALTDTGRVRSALGAVGSEPELFTGVAAGDGFSLGWDAAGDLFSWGLDDQGQLGRGSTGDARVRPDPVAIPAGEHVVHAAAGVDHAVALTAAGAVWAWGSSDAGQHTATPRRITLFDELPGTVVGVDAGGHFSLAWTSDGALYSWGLADQRLGRPGDDPARPARVTAQGLDARVVVHAAAGRFHGDAVVDGGVVAWGQDYGGAGGVALTGLPAGEAVGTAAGTADSLVWTAGGELYRTRTGTEATQRVNGLADVVGAAVSAPDVGEAGLWAWTDAGRLWAWGSNEGGKLGVGSPDGWFWAPSVVMLADGSAPRMIGAGGNHTLYDATDGHYAAAGDNTHGQLGDGTTSGRTRFALIIPVSRWP
jgi:alpha-tubulin suppressor-like RCC1 family protein